MSFQLMTWALQTTTGSPTRKAVLLALADRANQDTQTCHPSVDTIAAQAELSEKTVRRALEDLVEAGFITRTRLRRADGHLSVYEYQFLAVSVTARPADSLTAEPEVMVTAQEPGSSSNRQPISRKRAQVIEAWQAQLPLIKHRASILSEHATTRAVDRAIGRYGADDVVVAISNYATVLVSPEHYWTHRWTLVEFLRRGLDKFVPEAEPLRNFRFQLGAPSLEAADAWRQVETRWRGKQNGELDERTKEALARAGIDKYGWSTSTQPERLRREFLEAWR